MPVTPPRCKICGIAHWFSEPHAGATTKPKPLKAELPPVITGAQFAESLGHHGPKARDRAPAKPATAPTDRKAYMRELMRAKRAKAKAAQ